MSKAHHGKIGVLNPIEQLQEKPAEFLIVGIGASEEGMEALRDLFKKIPADSDMAYLVILRRFAETTENYQDLLQQESKIPVVLVTEKITLKPDHIFLIPSDQHLVIGADFIAASPSLHLEERRAPIDIFFRNLADQYGPRVISIILSGNGANGSMGLKRIKERGGATYVQNPREAQFNQMPRSAIATNLVDDVLNVSEIPGHIIAYRNSIKTVEIGSDVSDQSELQQQSMLEVFTQIRTRTGHDFSNYKRPTLLRRIERRINVHDLSDLPSYVAFLHENPNETLALLKDLLISVTNFFRDSKAFNAMEQEIIPALFAGKTSADEVRIWVAGCATGEEAYSIAMLCLEQLYKIPDPPKLQIFATDIDEAAIAIAREGCYTINDAADVSAERLNRFFTPEGENYRIRKEIRELILFANHNFLKDPPFSRLDLITCRNVLIYLNSTAQSRVIKTFHFALKPRKYLFLGTSESVDVANEMYVIHSREHHIFQTKQVSARDYPLPETLPQLNFTAPNVKSQVQDKDVLAQRFSPGELHYKLLEQYAPPSVVINQDYDIVHMSEHAGKYLEITGGAPTKNLLKLVRTQIRLELGAALYQAVQTQVSIEAKNLRLELDGQPHLIDIYVRPAFANNNVPSGLLLVIFNLMEEQLTSSSAQIVASSLPDNRPLEEELIGLRTQLRSAIEHHEYQSEEVKASNEELQTMNEELRSAAEELETSKEELQSINEELRTVNQELKVKIEETSLSSNNLQNLVNSANVGTIFLDRGFAIRLFTPAILEIFNLQTGDYGRPITDITNKLQYNHLLSDARNVLDRLTPIEREVKTTDNRIFMMQLLPYRTAEDLINGVVITFFDITKRKESEEALRRTEENYRKQLEQEVELRTVELKDSKEQYSTLIENTPDFITRWDKNLHLIFANAAFKKGALDKRSDLLGQASLQKAFDTGETVEHFSSLLSLTGETFFYSRITPERTSTGEISTVLAVTRDISEMKKAGIALKDSRDLLQSILDNSFVGMTVMKPVRNDSGEIVDFEITLANLEISKETGRTDLVGKYYVDEYPGVKETGIFDIMLRVMESGHPEGMEYFYPYEGFNKWYSCLFVKMGESLLATNIDTGERKKAEEYLRKSEERLRMFVTASSDLIYQMNSDWTLMNTLESNEFLTQIVSPTGDWMAMFIPKEDWEKMQLAIDHAISKKQVFELEHRVLLADGQIGWAYSKAVPLFGLKGEIIEWFGVASNITVRKSYEAEYDKNYLLLHQSEEVAGTGTWDYNLVSKTISWSEGMYRLFELEKGDPIGPEVYLKYAIPEQHIIASRITNLIRKGKSTFEESITINVNGKLKVLKTKATVVGNDEGYPARVLGVDMDVTISSLAEERLRQLEAKQQLEIFKVTLNTQEEERRRISESLHNGLAQLLFGIKISINVLSTELAIMDAKGFISSKKYTEKLLTNAITESRRISHELMPVLLDEFGLAAAIKDICEQVKEAVKLECYVLLRGLTLDKYFELAVYRIVQELVVNIVKHAQASSGKIEIAIKGREIMIKVTDNGKGIDDNNPETPGIGLASIRNKANALNGSVKLTSSPGNGTIVEVWLSIDTFKNEGN